MSINKNKPKNLIVLMSFYIIFYWLIATAFFIMFFGLQYSMKTMLASPLQSFSGSLLYLSSFLSSVIVFVCRKHAIQNPGKLAGYHYFLTGFYIGNLSLLILFFLDALLQGYVAANFPDVISILIGLMSEFLLSYLFFFAFLSLIPALLASFLVCKFIVVGLRAKNALTQPTIKS